MLETRVKTTTQCVTLSLFCSIATLLARVSILCSCGFSTFCALSLELDWLAATSGGCTRDGGSRSSIMHASWWVLFGTGKRCDLCSQDTQALPRSCALLLEDGPRRPRTRKRLRCQCCACRVQRRTNRSNTCGEQRSVWRETQ